MSNSEERRLEELREALDGPMRTVWGGYPWEHLGDAEKDVRWLLDRLEAAERELASCKEYSDRHFFRAEAAVAALAEAREALER